MNSGFHKTLLRLLILACICGPAFDVNAADDNVRKKGQVHYEPFEFPGGDDYVYFTLFVKPTKQSYLLDLCKLEPRVRETVNRMLYGRENLHKWGLKNRLLKKASAALKKRINKVVKEDMVDEVYFVRGYLDFEQGPVEEPTIPHPLTCKQIWFQAKSLRNPDDE